jgi:serine/threonine protein phosphatase PrpC
MQIATAALFQPGSGAVVGSPDQIRVDDESGLVAVADFVGEPEVGRVAARMALDGVSGHLSRHLDVLDRFRKHPTPALRERILALIEEGFARSSQEIFAFARRRAGLEVTLDVVLLLSSEAFVGHVGDGRVYLLRRGIVHQLSVDHVAAAPIEVGPGLDAAPSLTRSLARSLGPKPNVRVETMTMELMDGDRFVVAAADVGLRWSEQSLADALSGPLADLAGRVAKRAPGAGITAAVAQVGAHDAGDGGYARLAILQPMPLFAWCTEPELRQVAKSTHPRRFGRGAVLFHQGDPGNELYLLISGKVRIERDGQHIVTLGPGSNFGEMAMLDEPTRSATAIAEEPAELLIISKESFFPLLRGAPTLAVKILWNMLLTLSSNLRKTSARLAEATNDDNAVPRPPTPDQPMEVFDLVTEEAPAPRGATGDDIATVHDD